MRKKHFLFLAITSLAMLVSCEEKTNIQLLSKQIFVDSGASHVFIDFKCTAAWEATVDASWCTLLQTHGNGVGGRQYFEATVEANPLVEERIANVIIKAGSASETVQIVQAAGVAEISISPTFVRCVQAAREYTINVTSNGNWTATVDDTAINKWCTVTPAKGTGNATVTVSVAQNHAYPRRLAFISIVNNEKQLTDTILQDGELYSDPSIGVTINGITWATRNVNDFGTFTEWPTEAGKYYQFNRAVAYSLTNPVSPEWNSNPIDELKDWHIVNDPCPTGWRVPSKTEIENIGNSGYRLVKENDEVTGFWCGPDASLNNGEQAVFFPAVGGISSLDNFEGIQYSSYWSSTTYRRQFNNTDAYALMLSNDKINCFFIGKTLGLPVRCVKE